MTAAPDNLADACLVVAHPDDEVLWFSSILERVGQLIVCFEACVDLPHLGEGRARARQDYPLRHAEWLREQEHSTVFQVDWSRPEFSAHGLALNAPGVAPERCAAYQASYASLRDQLAPRLLGKKYVFTHNPWGEYGHPDHVQIARVIESLRPELGYRVLYSGYVAGRTLPLAAQVLPRLGAAFRLTTNAPLAQAIEQLYRGHGCWTWPVAHRRFDAESFLEDTGQAPIPGWGFELNCVTV